MSAQQNQVKYTSFSELKSGMGIVPNRLGRNGVGHILLKTKAVDGCIFGRTLSMKWEKPFDFPGLGEFLSVQNLAFWLKVEDHLDMYRNIAPHELHSTFVQYGHRNGKQTANRNAILLYAKFLQLKQDTLVRIPEALIDTPWVDYKILHPSGLRQAISFDDWYGPAVKSVYRMLSDFNRGVEMDLEDEFQKIVESHRLLNEPDATIPYTETLIKTITNGWGDVAEKPLTKKEKKKLKQAEAAAAVDNGDGATVDVQEAKEGIISTAQDEVDALANFFAAKNPPGDPVETMAHVDQEHAMELNVEPIEELINPLQSMGDFGGEDQLPAD